MQKLSLIGLTPMAFLLAACPGGPTGDPNLVTVDIVVPPSTKVHMVCAHQVVFQGSKITFGGLEIPITPAGVGPTVKIGSVESTPQVLQAASALIQNMDNAQMNFCRALAFTSSGDVHQLYIDMNTQQEALTTLMNNIAGAQTPTQLKNAVVTAGNLASTATTVPTSVASPTQVTATALAAPTMPAVATTPLAPTTPASPTSQAAPTTPASPATVLAGAAQAANELAATAAAAKALR